VPDLRKFAYTADASRWGLAPDGELQPARCNQRAIGVSMCVIGPADGGTDDLNASLIE
jgi:hypothetical protein